MHSVSVATTNTSSHKYFLRGTFKLARPHEAASPTHVRAARTRVLRAPRMEEFIYLRGTSSHPSHLCITIHVSAVFSPFFRGLPLPLSLAHPTRSPSHDALPWIVLPRPAIVCPKQATAAHKRVSSGDPSVVWNTRVIRWPNRLTPRDKNSSNAMRSFSNGNRITIIKRVSRDYSRSQV